MLRPLVPTCPTSASTTLRTSLQPEDPAWGSLTTWAGNQFTLNSPKLKLGHRLLPIGTFTSSFS